MKSISIKYYLVIVFLSTLFACSNTEEDKKNQTPPQDKQTNIPATTSDNKSVASPEVTTSLTKTSQPISELNNNAEKNKYDETYVVPNRFPLSEKDKKSDKKEKPTKDNK
ncbi:hypothetical protein [Aliikangiella sp. IMCC44359]|uniref:hypothetical protein n=1 Tax=Aliikangiella sp. IMCC44359 TaxID=3459125 RepID=UPI00403AB6C6